MAEPLKTLKEGVHGYLDVSTGHITRRDNELLEQDAKDNCPAYLAPVPNFDLPPKDHGLCVVGHQHGYFVFCGDFDAAAEEAAVAGGYSAALVQILKKAWTEVGCTWVKFDCDGWQFAPEIFPKFEW